MEAYKREFIAFLQDAGVLKFGDFTAKSGRKIPYFVNAGMIKTGDQITKMGEFYAKAYADKLGDKKAVLYGPAYKGISLSISAAVALSKKGLDLPFFFNRKEVKDHGEGGVFVGYVPQPGEEIVIIEDVITAGTAIRESMEILSNLEGTKVAATFIMVDRKEKGQTEKGAMQEFCTPIQPGDNMDNPEKLKNKYAHNFIYIMKNMAYTEYLDYSGVSENANNMRMAYVYPYGKQTEEKTYNFGDAITVNLAPLEAMVMEYASLRGTLDGMDTTAITEIANYFKNEIGYDIPPMTPFVGRNFNVTRAGIHADGLLKDEEIYNVFDTKKLLNRPASVQISKTSGLAGIAYWINGGATPTISSPLITAIGSFNPGCPIPTPIIIVAAVGLLLGLVFRFTTLGLYTQTVGINQRAARLNGINPMFIKLASFLVLGLCCAVAGCISVSRLSLINHETMLLEIEMDAILAVAIGGNALGGGKFKVTGSVLGAYAIQALTTTLYAMKVPSTDVKAYKAIVIILIVVISSPVVKAYAARLWKQLKARISAKKEVAA